MGNGTLNVNRGDLLDEITAALVAELDADEAAARATAEADLLARYPGLANAPDDMLIDLIATGADDPVAAMMDDADEAVAVAAIVLGRRLTAA